MRGIVLVAGVALSASACATMPFVRPMPATPVADAGPEWAAATAGCRDAQAYRAEVRLSGRIGGEKIRSVTLGLAVDRTGRIGLEARALGITVLRLGGDGASARLWLRDGDRVVTAPAGEIVEALMGVPLPPERLLALLSGCVSPALAIVRAGRAGDLLEVSTGDSVVYLHEASGGWRVRAGQFDGLLVDYQKVAGGRPARVVVTSEPGRRPEVALTLDVRTADVNPSLTGREFIVAIPDDAVPLAVADLRAAGPLGQGGSGQ